MNPILMKILQIGNGTKKDADELTSYLFKKHPKDNEDYLRAMAYDWVGVADESDLNENFTDESDPIYDMGIGSLKKIAFKFRRDSDANITKISLDYFGDKNHIGYAYVLWDFFKY